MCSSRIIYVQDLLFCGTREEGKINQKKGSLNFYTLKSSFHFPRGQNLGVNTDKNRLIYTMNLHQNANEENGGQFFSSFVSFVYTVVRTIGTNIRKNFDNILFMTPVFDSIMMLTPAS